MSGFREIELRDPCKTCEGRGNFPKMALIQALRLRLSELTKEHFYPCHECQGSGVIDTYKEKDYANLQIPN